MTLFAVRYLIAILLYPLVSIGLCLVAGVLTGTERLSSKDISEVPKSVTLLLAFGLVLALGQWLLFLIPGMETITRNGWPLFYFLACAAIFAIVAIAGFYAAMGTYFANRFAKFGYFATAALIGLCLGNLAGLVLSAVLP